MQGEHLSPSPLQQVLINILPFSYHSCPGVSLTYNDSQMNRLLLTFMGEKKMASHLHFTVVLGKCKRSVFSFLVPMHWISCSSSCFLHCFYPWPHPSPTLPLTPPLPTALHSARLLLKLSTLQFCFENSSISLLLSRDLRDGSEPWIEAITV